MNRYNFFETNLDQFLHCVSGRPNFSHTKFVVYSLLSDLTFTFDDIFLLERPFYFRYKQKYIKITFFMLMFTKIKIILLYSLLLIWFIPRYHNCESIENTDHCVKPKFGTKACEGSEMQGPTMALVPYNQNNDVLSIFNQPEREFNFAGQKLKISQDWNKLGVAAVVWDAVSVVDH